MRASSDRWTMICLTIPIVIYLLPAMQSDLDHGIRHLLPILPMIFVAVAIVFARTIRIWPCAVGAVGAILLIGLATESLAAFPDYIPFFNVAAGGSRGGIRLLGDSNLDWGQDLLLLAKWRQQHPDVKLYAATFGAIDPVRLGVQYVPLPSGYWGNQNSALPDPNQPCVLAISAFDPAGYLRARAVGKPVRGDSNVEAARSARRIDLSLRFPAARNVATPDRPRSLNFT